MNELKLKVGERFSGNVTRHTFQIVAIRQEYAIIRDEGLGKEFAYGLKALKHLAVTPIKEGAKC